MISAALLACAINVAPITLEKIIHAESGGNPLALHVNKLAIQPPPASTVQEAAAVVRHFVALGYSVDIGEMQINNRNLQELGYTIEDALEPCHNLSGGAAILTADYAKAAGRWGEGQPALLAAISAYNTGSFEAGFRNGYVSRVVGIPALPDLVVPARTEPAPAPPNPYTASTVVYSGEDLHVRVE
jgi:type IV secretion system protein VirB1